MVNRTAPELFPVAVWLKVVCPARSEEHRVLGLGANNIH
jgi:hypothetical protein